MGHDDPRTSTTRCRVLSWNVNGLRNCAAKFGGVARMLEQLGADVICLQEHKLLRKDLDHSLALVDGWDSFFSFHRGNSGYSGVVTFCRTATTSPVAAEEGLTGVLSHPQASRHEAQSNPLWSQYTVEQLVAIDQEGRVVITDHGEFILINIYAHALTNEETAEERRTLKRLFYKALLARVQQYQEQGRRVMVVGDYNICPRPLDHREPEPNEEWFSGDPDTSLTCWLHHLAHDGPEQGPWVDTFRLFHPARPQAYTCWSMATGARVNNWGSRIDLIMAAGPGDIRGQAAEQSVRHWVTAGDIWPEFQGSDHCPVWVDLCFSQPLSRPGTGSKPLPLNSRSVLGKQVKLTQWLAPTGSGAALRRSVSSDGSMQPAAVEDLQTATTQSQPMVHSSSQPNLTANGSAKTQARLTAFMATSNNQSARRPAKTAGGTPSDSGLSQGPTQPLPSGQLACDSHSGSATVQPPAQTWGVSAPCPPPAAASTPEPSTTSDRNADAAKAWKAIQQRMQAPKCSGHNETAVIRQVKKSGPNHGRTFYVCARPDGPAPQGRCDFFVWADNRVGPVGGQRGSGGTGSKATGPAKKRLKT